MGIHTRISHRRSWCSSICQSPFGPRNRPHRSDHWSRPCCHRSRDRVPVPAAIVPPALAAARPSALLACGEHERPVFKLLDPSETGVTFANTIKTDDSLNVQTDVYVYNGAGVAVGDIDNDGLPDIFFAGNKVSSRLYLNKGHMRFEDITEQAGVTTNRWATGVTMVDINDDGSLDIYVSVSGPQWSKPAQRANLLFVNNGNGTFTERGRAVRHRRHRLHHPRRLPRLRPRRLPRPVRAQQLAQRLHARRRGQPALGRPRQDAGQLQRALSQRLPRHFTNVSEQAGILREPGYGLGVVVSDLNGDGWPDIYVSNDVITNDVVYVNNGNGTFTDKRGDGSSTPASPAWASTSPTSTTTAGPTSCRST